MTRSGRSRPLSCATRHASSALTTPSVPSHAPPLRLESQCEPIPNARSPGPTLLATNVPTGSLHTWKPIVSNAARK